MSLALGHLRALFLAEKHNHGFSLLLEKVLGVGIFCSNVGWPPLMFIMCILHIFAYQHLIFFHYYCLSFPWEKAEEDAQKLNDN